MTGPWLVWPTNPASEPSVCHPDPFHLAAAIRADRGTRQVECKEDPPTGERQPHVTNGPIGIWAEAVWQLVQLDIKADRAIR